MKALEIAEKLGLKVLSNTVDNREITKVFCCDLLSIALSKAPTDGIWVTVMGNINTIAAGVMADIACIVLAENMKTDENSLKKAAENNIIVLSTENSIFDTAKAIDLLL